MTDYRTPRKMADDLLRAEAAIGQMPRDLDHVEMDALGNDVMRAIKLLRIVRHALEAYNEADHEEWIEAYEQEASTRRTWPA